MSRIKLIYDIRSSWEKCYIPELFNKIDYDIIYVEPDILKNKLNQEDEIIGNNILVFSLHNYSFSEILNIVLRIKPMIIVYLSDEFGVIPEYATLASYTKLFLHQYHFKHYSYNYKNSIQIPLGYMTGMFNNNSAFNIELKPIIERTYKWSFIGNIKKDRLELIRKFANKFNENESFYHNDLTPSEMFEVYNDTIFVPNGRGNVVIDCFRIYEAILSGSIPIIVCEETEFKNTFNYNNDIPPFILEKNWDDAVNKCEYLLNNIEELENVQKKNYEWLQNKIISIQELIYSTIHE